MASDCYLGDKCRGPKYHVCLAGKENNFDEALKKFYGILHFKAEKSKRRMRGSQYEMTDEHRQNITASARERWAKHHEQHAERNREIFKLHIEGGWSQSALASRFNTSKPTINSIIKRMREEASQLV